MKAVGGGGLWWVESQGGGGAVEPFSRWGRCIFRLMQSGFFLEELRSSFKIVERETGMIFSLRRDALIEFV